MLGAAYTACGRSKDAVWAYRHAVNLVPRSATFQFELALALERAGNPRGASAAMAIAVALDPGHEPAWDGLQRLRAAGYAAEPPDLADILPAASPASAASPEPTPGPPTAAGTPEAEPEAPPRREPVPSERGYTCPDCGAALVGGSRRCLRCGSLFAEAVPDLTLPPPAPAAAVRDFSAVAPPSPVQEAVAERPSGWRARLPGKMVLPRLELPEAPEGGWKWPRWATRASAAAGVIALVVVVVLMWNRHQVAALVGEYVAREDQRLRLSLTERGTFRLTSASGSASGVYRLEGGRVILTPVETSGRFMAGAGNSVPAAIRVDPAPKGDGFILDGAHYHRW